MASVSSLGLGVGIDVNKLLTDLIAAQQKPAANRLDFKEATYQAELTAVGTLKGALSSFNSTVGFYKNSSAFNTLDVTSSDSTVASATADATAIAGDYNIKVSTLAKAHTIASPDGEFTQLTDVVGTGVLTFQFGTVTYTGDEPTGFSVNGDKAIKTITIDESNKTLEGVRDAINNADIGVSANTVFDGTDYRLTLTSTDSGANNAIELTVADDDGNSTDSVNLSRLTFNTTTSNAVVTTKAQDAAYTINGLAVTSSTNQITDAIGGVTLNLAKEQAVADSDILISIKKNTSIVSNAVREFVNSYNELKQTLNAISNYDVSTKQGGILLGDSVVRDITFKLRQELNNPINGLGGTFKSLADIGVSTETDGTLKVNTTQLNAAVASDSEAVSRIFSITGKSDATTYQYVSSTANTIGGNYAINVTTAPAQGNYAGTAFGYGGSITIDGNNSVLAVRVDGTASTSVTIASGSYTGDQLAAKIQTQLNGETNLSTAGVTVNVSFDSTNKVFNITSSSYGSDSKVEIITAGSTAEATIGLSTSSGTITTGVDVVGTIGGVSSVGSGRFLTGQGENVNGLKVEILGSTTGNYGSLSFVKGISDRIDSFVTGVLASNGAINSKQGALTDQVKGITEQRATLAKRMSSLESRLRAQFQTLDLLVSNLNATSNFLTSQLGNLPSLGALRK